MNNLWEYILKESKKEKIKQMEQSLSFLKEEPIGSRIECPFCFYHSKNGAVSGKIFEDKEEHTKIFKCFSCGKWRAIK